MAMAPLLLLYLAIFALLASFATAKIALVSVPGPQNSLGDAFCVPQRLYGGDSISNGLQTLKVQKDCSLRLYQALIILPIWTLNSKVDTQDCYLFLDKHGVLYVQANDNSIGPVAIFGTPGDYGRYALILGDRRLGVYGPAIWSNGAAGPNPEYVPSLLQLPSLAETANNLIFSGDKFTGKDKGDVEVASQDDVTAVIQPGCTLAVKKKDGTVIWATWSEHVMEGTCTLRLKDNGELVLADAVTKFVGLQWVTVETPIWTSGYTGEKKRYVCVLWCSGEMVVYGEKEWLYKPLIVSSIRAGMLMLARGD